MFGKRDLSKLEAAPPTTEQILEDLEKSGPDDTVFTTDIASGVPPIDGNFYIEQGFSLKPRFQKKSQEEEEKKEEDGLYEKVIEHNQNLEKVETLSSKLNSKIVEIKQLKEDLDEDYHRVAERCAEAAHLYKEFNSHNN